MKNEEISLETKKALALSLKKAMRQKNFSKITVKEIIQDCGVNRNTFYYHFDDIYALLRWMLTEEAIEVVKHFDLLVDYEDAIRFIMDYADENDYIISCAYDAIGRDEKAQKHLEPEFKDFLANFYTEALAGTLADWAREKHIKDKEKIILYLKTIIETSLNYFNL